MKKSLAMLLVLFPVLMQAHPGHGVGAGHEILHYLASPLHMGLALLVVGFIMFIVKFSFKKAKRA